MTDLELYKFIKECDVEWKWEKFDGEEYNDIVMFISTQNIDEFQELIKDYLDAKGFYKCNLKTDCIAVRMCAICDFYDIDMDKVFCG
ncbi:MAG: hypothetical protein GX793_01505 [Bacteroidales bacterium]|jgi:hypothetical protein|nr:hypothetical protein [Bacteroidales bacterium]MCK9499962.1 hypothetical protein [Bacteroidales bacterium]MDY0315663.1 hypothetical protein [Bacteroidales bacterium]NLB85715.1 hypothetical protein [Bacteroidales bacterium]